MISIVIPTYNNLNYLKLCLKSLKKNSSFKHEIIIHINDGSDGTLDFIKAKIIDGATPPAPKIKALLFFFSNSDIDFK